MCVTSALEPILFRHSLMSVSSCSINLFPCTKKSLLALVLSRSGSAFCGNDLVRTLKSGRVTSGSCPLYPRKRTSLRETGMSALCHRRKLHSLAKDRSCIAKRCRERRGPYLPAFSTAEIWTKVHTSALLFLQWRIGFIRRRLGFGALGFTQRSFLVLLSLFLLAPSTCRPRSLGSISSVIWLKCHCALAG